jgi:hypothetical protein
LEKQVKRGIHFISADGSFLTRTQERFDEGFQGLQGKAFGQSNLIKN